jgi:hypothetical protein
MFRGLRRAALQRALKIAGGDTLIKVMIVSVLALVYIFLIYTNPNRQEAINAVTPASYYLPDFFIATTLVIPVIAMWWFGFSAAFLLSEVITRSINADQFKAQTKILYGIWAIIFTSILLQALLSLGAGRLMSIGLGPLLGIVYVFIVLQGVGYLFVSLGARQLNVKRGK